MKNFPVSPAGKQSVCKIMLSPLLFMSVGITLPKGNTKPDRSYNVQCNFTEAAVATSLTMLSKMPLKIENICKEAHYFTLLDIIR